MKQCYTATPINVILLLLLAFLFTSTTTTYEITGTLVDEDGSAIADHRVLLVDENDEQVTSNQTDSQGRFSLSYQTEPTSAEPGLDSESPSEFRLGSSYPNPFNPHTTVPFQAPENTSVIISIHNILGQQIMHTRTNVSSGTHEIAVNLGGGLSQGQYLLRVQGEGFSLTETMTFVSAGISSGSPGITVRSGGQMKRNISASMHLADAATYRIVVEETDKYSGKQMEVAVNKSEDVGSVVLARNEYPLNITIEGEGSVEEEIVTAKQYEHGTVVRLTAVPDEGWRFDGWSGDAEGSDSSVEITVDNEKNITATFVKREYPLNITIEGEGTVEEEIVTAKSYEHGTVARLTAEPAEGWDFLRWDGDLSTSDNPVEIVIDEKKEVAAVFVKKYFELTIITEGSGSVTSELQTGNESNGSYEFESEVELLATADDGWVFVEWIGDIESEDNPIILEIPDNVFITAVFEKKYSLTTSIKGEGKILSSSINGKITEGGYLSESEVEIVAVPDAGWRFVEWQGDLEGSNNPDTLIFDRDKIITAVFSLIDYSVSIKINGNGTVSITPEQEVYNYGDELAFEAIAAEGNLFEGWFGSFNTGDNPYLHVVTDDVDVTAIFFALEEAVGSNFYASIIIGSRVHQASLRLTNRLTGTLSLTRIVIRDQNGNISGSSNVNEEIQEMQSISYSLSWGIPPLQSNFNQYTVEWSCTYDGHDFTKIGGVGVYKAIQADDEDFIELEPF